MLLTAAHVWHLAPHTLRAELLEQPYRSWLTPEELVRIDALRMEPLRHTHRAARVLRNLVLSHYTGVHPAVWRFGTGAHGKPRVDRPGAVRSLRFNLTHTDGLVGCIVSRAGDVGLDAEETSRAVDIAEVAPHFFSAREQARLAESSPDERAARFFEQWVVKEAYFKGRGTGVPDAPERLTIEWNDDSQPLPPGNWQFILKRLGECHVAAAAVHSPAGESPIPVQWFDAAALVEAGVAVER
jgi:4'-phosphopantetheinyl transferase